jgi:hypothetical protein
VDREAATRGSQSSTTLPGGQPSGAIDATAGRGTLPFVEVDRRGDLLSEVADADERTAGTTVAGTDAGTICGR